MVSHGPWIIFYEAAVTITGKDSSKEYILKDYIMTTYKKLLRSRDRWIAGVCGGLANYFGWDPALVRIGYLLLSLCSAAFPGLLIYVILWICMPQES